MKPRRAFTIVELLVVIGVIAILGSLVLPALFANLEGARINETQAQLQIFETALSQYQRQFGDYPLSAGAGDNTGIEAMLAAVRGTWLKERIIVKWLDDTDHDGRQELVDPWQNPWVYFHSSDYSRGVVYYMSNGARVPVVPAKKGDVFRNLTTYQLWSCGPNKTDESGQGDDVGNIGP